MINRIRFRNCIHQGVAGATEESILAAIRGDSQCCLPDAATTNLSPSAGLAVFSGLARYLGADLFTQCWTDFQRSPERQLDLADFPAFLAENRHGRERAELVDLSRLDVAIFLADTTNSELSVGRCCLPSVILTGHPALTVKMQPNWSYLQSNWPIHQFRDALLPYALGDKSAKPLRRAAVWLNIANVGGDTLIRELPKARFLFESTLHRGDSLQNAVRCAIDADPRFDMLASLAALIGEGAITEFNLHPNETN
jgi:hypothetical protein